MTDLAQVNRILDRTCKRAGLDPVEVRLAMIQTLQAKLQNGKGFDRLPPEPNVTGEITNGHVTCSGIKS